MRPLRRRDRLDRRLADGRLRSRHVRAVARALAGAADTVVERSACAAEGPVGCDAVRVRGRHVRFDADPRAAGDDAKAAAALANDLAARGAPRLAETFAAAFAIAADDYGVYRLLSPPEGSDAPRVVAVAGRAATGKSTLARAVARRLAAPRVSTDRVRDALLDALPDRLAHELAWDPDFAAQVYGGVLERAAFALASGRSVVLDGCFRSPEQRSDAAALAARHGAVFVLAICESPPGEVAARLRHRDERDDVRPGSWREIADLASRSWEEPRDDEPGERRRIDTTWGRRAQLRALGLGPEARA